MNGLWICFALIAFIPAKLQASKDNINQFAKRGYDKSVRPLEGVSPVKVTVQIIIWSMASINEHDFTYDIGYVMNTWWVDPGLTHGNHSITVTEAPEDHIWYPDMMVTNSNNNRRVGKDIVTKISSNGGVYISQRLKATCSCVMDLSSFPMDIQNCPLSMESYAYDSLDLNLVWHHKAVDVVEGFGLSGYSYEGEKHKKFSLNYTIGDELLPWDQLVVKFALKRSLPYYVFRIYVPSILLMIFNVGSFWIPHGALPGRIALVVTTFLTNTFILQSVTEQTAKAAITTSLHIFIVINIAFIVVAIVEYLLVLRLKALEQKKTNALKAEQKNKERRAAYFEMSKQNASPDEAVNRRDVSEDDLPVDIKDTQNDVHKLDKICRFLMPVLYLIFCIIYFSYYLSHYHGNVHKVE